MDIKFPEGFIIKETGEMYLNDDTIHKLQISVDSYFGKQNRYLGSATTANYDDFINVITTKRNSHGNSIKKGLIKISIYVKPIMSQDRTEVYHGELNDEIIDELIARSSHHK